MSTPTISSNNMMNVAHQATAVKAASNDNAVASKTSSHNEQAAALRELLMQRVRHRSSSAIAQRTQPPKERMPDKGAPNLEALPAELTERITPYLTKREFSTLRLSSRIICAKINYRFIKRFFETRTIKITWDSLRHFANSLCDETLRRALKHLVVVVEGFAYDSLKTPRNELLRRHNHARRTYKDAADAKALSDLLERCLSRITTLCSMELLAATKCTARDEAVAMTFAALASNNIQLKALRIGGSPDVCSPNVPRHSWNPFTDLRHVLCIEEKRLRRSLASLQHLELTWGMDDTRKFPSDASDLGACTHKLLSLIPNIKSLTLHEPLFFEQAEFHLGSFEFPLPMLKTVYILYPPLHSTDRYQRMLMRFLKSCWPGVERIHMYWAPNMPHETTSDEMTAARASFPENFGPSTRIVHETEENCALWEGSGTPWHRTVRQL